MMDDAICKFFFIEKKQSALGVTKDNYKRKIISTGEVVHQARRKQKKSAIYSSKTNLEAASLQKWHYAFPSSTIMHGKKGTTLFHGSLSAPPISA